MDDAEAIATDMQHVADADILTGDILFHEYRPDLIHQLLSTLHVSLPLLFRIEQTLQTT